MRAILVALLLFPSVALAQPGAAPPPPPPPPGYGAPPPAYGYEDPKAHRHDGFYLRFFLGLGYTSMNLDDADLTVSGAGGAFGIAAGFAVSDNLIVFAEIFDDIAVNPKVEQGGSSIDTEDVNAGVVAIGAGIAYYIQPSNMYVSGTLSLGQLTVQQDGEEIGESDFGPGVSLMVGKEWWVSNNWGLGVALQLYAGSMKDSEDGGPTWKTTAAAIVGSATFN
jgi:hypothetical protein